MCSHLTYYKVDNKDSNFLINGKNVFDKKCTNKDIRQVFNEKNRVIPKGTFYWNSILRDVNWRKAWLLPYKCCISNKVREIHLKILHKIYPTNMLLSNLWILGNNVLFVTAVRSLYVICLLIARVYNHFGKIVFQIFLLKLI